ncbi:MAG: hypothetical protein GXY15_14585 [Candidatus Hydrogenedentes bacterium]|nr:hypothetical protein [Candidatus Hydrogenedentota bacterium]
MTRFLTLLSILLTGACIPALSWAAPEVLEEVPVAKVWAGHPVGFCLLTDAPRQYVAFYDADRWMTVGMRTLGEKAWTFARLPERVLWDSHNGITLVLDDAGHLHLCGNMHVDPLVYYRTTAPGDVTSFQRIHNMVGPNEDKCTYPQFLRGAENELVFTYRDGKSGEGNQVYNAYDVQTEKWRRLLASPLTDGEGLMNAYFQGPVRGPDGLFHLCWVWRDHYGCESNHDLSYARSRDLVHWEDSRGNALPLPIKLADCDIVDPVPVKGGMINGNHKIGFDSKNRVIISYHKFDANGITQLYNARLEDDKWVIRQASEWDYRWWFEGGGTIVPEVGVGSVAPEGEGRLAQTWSHVKLGEGGWLLDEETLKTVGPLDRPASRPASLSKVTTDHPDMQVNWCADTGENTGGGTYVLRWETMKKNRDRPRESYPEPGMLMLYRIGGE